MYHPYSPIHFLFLFFNPVSATLVLGIERLVWLLARLEHPDNLWPWWQPALVCVYCRHSSAPNTIQPIIHYILGWSVVILYTYTTLVLWNQKHVNSKPRCHKEWRKVVDSQLLGFVSCLHPNPTWVDWKTSQRDRCFFGCFWIGNNEI